MWRLRFSTSNFVGSGMPRSLSAMRSMRSTVAPISASIIAAIGHGPMPANSMILMPASGPMRRRLGRLSLLGNQSKERVHTENTEDTRSATEEEGKRASREALDLLLRGAPCVLGVLRVNLSP